MLITLIIFTGCSSDKETSKKNTDDNVSQEVENEKETDDKPNKEQNDIEGRLLKIGQTAKDTGGIVELLKIKSINKTIEEGPLKIELINAKIIKRTDMPQDYLGFINQFAEVDEGDELSYIQLRYNVENTSDQDVAWGSLQYIVTDQKEQIDAFMGEFISMNNNSQVLGNVEKEYVQGYILTKPDVNNIRLVFDSVSEADSYDPIAEKAEYEFSFE